MMLRLKEADMDSRELWVQLKERDSYLKRVEHEKEDEKVKL